jgi:acyl dehydratase
MHLWSNASLNFEDFRVGQTFDGRITITKEDFEMYIAFARTRNILHEDAELAAKEGIKDMLVPGRAMIARAEGEMTRLDAFAGKIMLLYGMDGDPAWNSRHTRFLGEVYAGEELVVKYTVVGKDEKDNRYGILSIDFEITRSSDGKLVAVSRRNLYRMKK